jgi:hypothetical protein
MYVLICLLIIAAAAAMIFVPQLKSWRTIIFNAVVAGLGGVLPLLSELLPFLQGLNWTQYVTENAVPWVVLGVGVAGIMLRYATSGPVGQK